MTTKEGIENDLDVFDRLEGRSKTIVQRRMIDAGVILDERVKKLGAYPDGLLERGWDRSDEEKWIGKLRDYESMCDIRDRITATLAA